MSEADDGAASTPDKPPAPSQAHDPMYLGKVIADGVAERTSRAPAQWIAENAVDPVTGKNVLNVSSAYDLLQQPPKGWRNLPTIRGLAAALGWQHSAIYVPNAVAIGLDPPGSGASVFASMLPAWVDQLPASVQMHLREEITLFGRAHGLTD